MVGAPTEGYQNDIWDPSLVTPQHGAVSLLGGKCGLDSLPLPSCYLPRGGGGCEPPALG